VADGHEKYLGEDYNTLMLVAGGSGVSYTLSNAMDLVRRARAMHIGSEDKTIAIATRRLQFVWMVKKPGMYLACLSRRCAHRLA
jgi:hypothetical protein